MPGSGRRFKRGQSKPTGSGRKKGVPNRFSERLVDAIAASFEQLGSTKFLVELARAEPRAYAALLGRLLPAQVVARAEIEQAGPACVVFRWEGESDCVGDAASGDAVSPPS